MSRTLHNLNYRRIDFAGTWRKLSRAFDNPETVRPPEPPAEVRELLEKTTPKRKLKLPQLRSNVYNTAVQVYAIFMQQWERYKGNISKAIVTTCLALAKRAKNRDPKTAYRHILALIEAGILKGKIRVYGRVELLLNEDLLVFLPLKKGQNHAMQAAVAGALPAAAELAVVEDHMWKSIVENALNSASKKAQNTVKPPF